MLTKEAAMSFSQFGYPYNATSQFFVSANPSTTCCDSISRSVADESSASHTAASLCCPPYESRLLGGTRTELSGALGMYGSPYAASHSYANYFPYSADPSALYSTLNPQYDIKDGAGSLHSGITQPAAYYPYDHSLGQYQYDRYGAVDFNSSARRKNATRETTSTLKAWLYEHRKNPYPTKGEKIMLAIITKMTLTQVSTWFANARRRLKKENKMTWSPKNKAGDETKDDIEKSDQDCVSKDSKDCKQDKDLQLSDLDDMEEDDCDKLDSDRELVSHRELAPHGELVSHRELAPNGELVSHRELAPHRPTAGDLPKGDCHVPLGSFHPFARDGESAARLASGLLDPAVAKPTTVIPPGPFPPTHFGESEKPRIWSLAHTAALVPHRAGDPRPGSERCGPPSDATNIPSMEDSFQDGRRSQSKVYSTCRPSAFSHKPLQPNCSSYNGLSNACQYSSIEGFSSGRKPEPHQPNTDTCLPLQDDTVTTFRPLMKR